MSASKQLPLNIQPPIVGYSSHAKALAILSTDSYYLDWYYCNYIQLRCLKDFDTQLDVPLDFYIGINKGDTNYYSINPFLYTQTLKRETLSLLEGNIVQFLIKCIDLNLYVDLMMEEYYIPNRASYKKRRFTHDNLIYGYNSNEKTFDIIGYDISRRYNPSKVSFTDLELAFHSIQISHWGQYVHLYNKEEFLYGPPSERYKFSITNVISSLSEYINSFDSSISYKSYWYPSEQFAYGIEVYAYLSNNIIKSKQHAIDIRPIHILWEHKVCMLNRIKFINQLGYFSQSQYEYFYNAFESLANVMLVTRNLQLKYSFTFDEKIITTIIVNLDYVKNKEQDIISELIDVLKRAQNQKPVPYKLT